MATSYGGREIQFLRWKNLSVSAYPSGYRRSTKSFVVGNCVDSTLSADNRNVLYPWLLTAPVGYFLELPSLTNWTKHGAHTTCGATNPPTAQWVQTRPSHAPSSLLAATICGAATCGASLVMSHRSCLRRKRSVRSTASRLANSAFSPVVGASSWPSCSFSSATFSVFTSSTVISSASDMSRPGATPPLPAPSPPAAPLLDAIAGAVLPPAGTPLAAVQLGTDPLPAPSPLALLTAVVFLFSSRAALSAALLSRAACTRSSRPRSTNRCTRSGILSPV
mmetsp:Transcript_35346/g.80194  ORF Transcript_35346/g.80194 Transcript_35346/m.80194 type:complete len:278 (+) Transcript_35346:706-1539(+)